MSMFRARANPTPHPHPPAHHHGIMALRGWPRCVITTCGAAVVAVTLRVPSPGPTTAPRRRHIGQRTPDPEARARTRTHRARIRTYTPAHRTASPRTRAWMRPHTASRRCVDGPQLAQSTAASAERATPAPQRHLVLLVCDWFNHSATRGDFIHWLLSARQRTLSRRRKPTRQNEPLRTPGIGILSRRTRWVASLWRAAGMEHTSSAGVAAT